MLVYKDKGPHDRPGGTFDFKGVSKASELKEALDNGYFLTMEGVQKGKDPDSVWRTPELETLEDDLTPPEEREPEEKEPELPEEESDATEKREEPEGNPTEHQNGDEVREIPEAGSGDSLVESGEKPEEEKE